MPPLIAHASAAPLPPFPADLFQTGSYELVPLSWSALPYNGEPLPLLDPGRARRDASGIAFLVRDGKVVYNPGSIAQEGCRYLDGYVRTGNRAYLAGAEVRAAKLRTMAVTTRGATWLMYHWTSSIQRLAAPWPSALAQGAGTSFFVRLYRLTGDPSDLAMARSLMVSFRMLGTGHSPWVAYVDSGRLLRLEEYPGPIRSHVFNGAGFGFFGIYEYAMLTGDATAIALARGHLATIRATASLYRVPGGVSWYDLAHLSRHAHYHAVDTWELFMMARMGGGDWFSQLGQRFRDDDSSAEYP